MFLRMKSIFRFLPGLLGAGLLTSLILRSEAAAPDLTLELVTGGLNRPVYVTAPPNDHNRLFIVEQHSGRIRIFNRLSQLLEPTDFVRVTGLTTGGEQGLLGLAFHPGYATNGFFYVNYTTTGGGAAGRSVVARYQVEGDPLTASTAPAASRTLLLTFDQPASNHNGGWIGFGPDGYLYISTGDGGQGDDPWNNAQNRTNLLGKMLRIDVNAAGPALYQIPADNPFFGHASFAPEIWAFGLRNPWRSSFDRATGDLWIGDVGQSAREEINVNPAGVGGLNFGWRPREGFIQNPRFPNETPVTTATDPVHDYPRTLGISVTGGYVYRGQAIPGLVGEYLFADYGSARFWSFRYEGSPRPAVRDLTAQINPGSSTTRPVAAVSSFGEDAAGELYVCEYRNSGARLYRIVAVAAPLQISDLVQREGEIQFSFQGQAGQAYQVQYRDAVDAGEWLNLMNLTGSATPVQVTAPIEGAQRFYRVRQVD
jgi:glucose/arabinose dehydrogenase